MRSFLFFCILTISISVFGQKQDSIPHYTALTREVFQCLQQKNYQCLEDKMYSLKEYAQLMNPYLKDVENKTDSFVGIDTSQTAFYQLGLKQSIDTLYARADQVEIDWKHVVFMSMSDSTVDSYMLREYGDATSQCTIKFSEGENIYGIEYALRFINKQWKIEQLHPCIVVYNKDGTEAGVMRETYDIYMDGYSHPGKEGVYKKK